VVIGGLISATVLTLYVLPLLYGRFAPRLAPKIDASAPKELAEQPVY
jgi:Cu/Ag efflux pump CusA